jgi:hypothetical protein
MDVLVVVLTVLGLVFSGVAAWAAIRSVILTKRGLETQQEQLCLQREQAAMVPELKCSDVRFLDPDSVEEVLDTIQEAEKGKQEEKHKKDEREQYHRDLAAWEARQSMPGLGSMLPRPRDPDTDPIRHIGRFNLDSLTLAQRSYRGPIPDAVVEVPLHNKGRTAARDIIGFISLDRNLLELLNFPGLDAYEVSGPDKDGFLTAEVGTISEILPKQEESFRVAVTLYPPSKETVTEVRYDFITPAGHAAEGKMELTFPGPSALDEPDEQNTD